MLRQFYRTTAAIEDDFVRKQGEAVEEKTANMPQRK